MTLHPVLPPVLLVLLACVVVAARIAALRRLWSGGRATSRGAVWRWTGLTVAAALLLVAAVRPVIGRDEQTLPAGAYDGEPNVFLVVDRSAGMGVADLPGGRSRMDAARDDIAAVLDRYPNARFSVIAFASGPSLEWPLSQDTWSLRPVAAAMRPYGTTPDDVLQTNAGAASTVLRYQLIAASQQFPRARNLVFYLGAGAGESEAPQRNFELAEGSVDGGAVLGYGSVAGGVIPQAPEVRSGIDEARLRDVADQLGVRYVPRGGATSDDNAVFDDATEAPPPDADVQASSHAIETYWAAALVAALLILLELYHTLRDVRRMRSVPRDVTP